MLGKSVSDLQSNITVGGNAITGTLRYVTGYTGFSSKTEEQSGNYLVIHCAAEDADSVTVEVVGGDKGPVTLDADGIIILRIKNNSQKIRVTAYKDGAIATVRTYSLNNLNLEGA